MNDIFPPAVFSGDGQLDNIFGIIFFKNIKGLDKFGKIFSGLPGSLGKNKFIKAVLTMNYLGFSFLQFGWKFTEFVIFIFGGFIDDGNFIGIELDKGYFEIAKARIEGCEKQNEYDWGCYVWAFCWKCLERILLGLWRFQRRKKNA